MEIYENLSLEDLPNEEWRELPNMDGLYLVSNLGRVKALSSIRKFGDTTRHHKERIIKQFPNWQGYLGFYLSNLKQEKIRYSGHRAVAETFIPNPNSLPCVNHKNENKSDNRVENLEWCTYAYNIKYGSREHDHEKKILQYDLCGNFLRGWDSITKASQETKTHRNGISNCLMGRAKSSGGFIWKYKDDEFVEKLDKWTDGNKRAVECFDINGNYINQFVSIADAGRFLGVCDASISANCRGLQNNVINKYIFKYKNQQQWQKRK